MEYRVAQPFDRSQYKFPRFSDKEYSRRHKKIREFMADRNLECLLITGGGCLYDRGWTNVAYVTNYLGSMELFGYLVFPMEGEPVTTTLVYDAVQPAEAARNLFGELRGSLNYIGVAIGRLKELGLQKGRIGIVEIDERTGVPKNHWDALVKELPDAEFVTVTQDWWRMRREKSSEEISALEQAAHWDDLAHDTLSKTIRPGISELGLFSAVYNAVYSNGAEHSSMLLLASGPMGRPHTAWQRHRPIDRVIEKGDMVITEIGPRTPTGYEAQSGRTFTVGKPTQLYKDMFALATETYHRIVEVLRPSNAEPEVYKAASIVAEAGYDSYSPWIHGMYGLPRDGQRVFGGRIPDSEVKSPDPFIPNQLVTVEVHVSKFGAGVFITDPYIVSADGPARRLTKYPLEITIL